MIVLTFAYKGEALEFIKRKHVLPVDFYFKGLYRDGNELLVITGPGAKQAAATLSKICSYFGNRIQGILNLGIAGSLNPELQLNQIYGIRLILHEFETEEYTCASHRADRTCITAEQPVGDDRYAAKLRARGADCVDTEAWGLATACHAQNLRFQAYKLISDRAGVSTNSREIIKQAPVHSKHLFDFYKKLDYSFLVKG